MSSKTGSYKFHIESYVCDFTEKAPIYVISNYLFDATSMHAQRLGFGYEHITRDNVAWVLSRLSIAMSEYPNQNEDFTVETWVEEVSRYFTQRCYRFTNFQGEIIGYGRSIWAAIDMVSRRPIDLREWRSDLQDYIEPEMQCPIEKMEKIHSVEGVEPVMGYAVRYSDIDINKHLSSMKYIEHAVNVFDLQMFRDNFIRQFEIVFLAEGKYGDKLKLYRNDLSENEFIIDTKRGEESICRSRVIWSKK